MSSILISSQTCTHAEVIASRTADLLDFRNVGGEVFALAAKRFGISEKKLRDALTEAPSLFGMSHAMRKRSLAYVQATLSTLLLDDRIVFHGPFAHALLTGVSHVLRVRIVATDTCRRDYLSRAERLGPKKAARRLASDDQRASAISGLLFGKDMAEEGLDLVVEVDEGQEEAAAETIAHTARSPRYAAMTFSRKVMREVELTHRVLGMLADLDPNASATVMDGKVSVRAHALASKRDKTQAMIEERIRGVDGVGALNVQVLGDDLVAAGRR